MKTRIIQNEPDKPANGAQTVDVTVRAPRRSSNLAARMGRWSASHKKTAIFGWLAFIAGARSSNQQINAYARLHALIEDFTTRPILDFDQSSALELEKLKASKVRVGTMDLKIAAIAIVHDALLISRNLSDFRKAPGLHVEDWTD